MVAMNDGHDHAGGNVCPGCRFRKALAEFLADAHEDGRQEWHWATGDLRQSMHAALLALDAMDAAAFDDEPKDSDEDPAADAANAITDLGAEIEQLWHTLMDGVSQGDDPDAGL
jgi:hypothetical protein